MTSPTSNTAEFIWYDYKIKWTEQHQKAEKLQHLIHTYDGIATDAIEEVYEELAPPNGDGKDLKRHGDMFKLVKQHAGDGSKASELWSQVNTVPTWVDWDQIERGQNVFWRYSGAAVTALGYLSLLGSMASGRTVETLDRTGGFGTDKVRRRLLETTQHTLGVHKDLESIKPGGEGWEASVRVRLLHASVRRRILHLAKENPSYYNVEEYGVPINDLDSMVTIANFSATMIWIGFPRQGIFLQQQEIVDYLALWRYVAYLMGTPHDFLATPTIARATMESILFAEYKPNKASPVLARNIVTGMAGHPPTYASAEFLNAITYWLNGKTLSEELEIEKPTFYYNALVVTQCCIFMTMSYPGRIIPYWDKFNIKIMKARLYDALIENKEKGALGYRTKFGFKYMPEYDNKVTALGKLSAEQQSNSGAFRRNGAERATLVTMSIAVAGLIGGIWALEKRLNMFR